MEAAQAYEGAWHRTTDGCLFWGGQESALLTATWDGQCQNGGLNAEGTLRVREAVS
jgi:hypothetical protein